MRPSNLSAKKYSFNGKRIGEMNGYVREYLKKDCSGQLQELFSQSTKHTDLGKIYHET
jgi:hypothetical protein